MKQRTVVLLEDCRGPILDLDYQFVTDASAVDACRNSADDVAYAMERGALEALRVCAPRVHAHLITGDVDRIKWSMRDFVRDLGECKHGDENGDMTSVPSEWYNDEDLLGAIGGVEYIRCGWISMQDGREDAEGLVMAAEHAVHRPWRMGECDAPLCVETCGNTPRGDGFACCDERGIPVEPAPGGADLLVCQRCGRIIASQSGKVVGKRSNAA